MLKFSIPDDYPGDHLSLFWLSPKAKWRHYDDEYDVEIEVVAGNFGGKYKAQVFLGEVDDFKNGLKNLYNNLSATLNFQSIEVIYEHQLKLKISGDGHGHFEMECEAVESFRGSRLSFTLKFDQSHIPRMIRELEEMLI